VPLLLARFFGLWPSVAARKSRDASLTEPLPRRAQQQARERRRVGRL